MVEGVVVVYKEERRRQIEMNQQEPELHHLYAAVRKAAAAAKPSLMCLDFLIVLTPNFDKKRIVYRTRCQMN